MISQKRIASCFRKLLILIPFFGAVWTSVAAEEADLGADYGFKAIEILKLDWDLGLPLCCDINGDGLNDIVVANNRKSRIELLLQKADYQADFQPDSVSQEVADQTNPNEFIGNDRFWRYKLVHYPLDVSVTSLLVSDLNGDGRQDMVYLCPEGLRIVYQEGADAAGVLADLAEPKWRPEISFDIEDALKTARSLDGGDLNHDGRLDLVVLAAGGYYLCLQNESGDFERPVKHFSTSEAIRHLEVGDIDGDGLDDLVLFVGDDDRFPLRVRLQDGDGALGPERRLSMPVPSIMGLCRLSASPRHSVVAVARQSGRLGLFDPVTSQTLTETVSMYPLPVTEDAQQRAIVPADINGDGLTDMVVTNPVRAQFLVFQGQAGKGLRSAQIFPGLKDMSKVCAGRLGDTTRDTLIVLSYEEKLIAQSRYLQGRLQFPQALDISGEPQTMALADINGDAALDLVYVSKDRDDIYSLRILLHVGTAQADAGPIVELEEIEERPVNLIVCDIDHNGLEDVMVVREFDPLMLIRQMSPGVFEHQTEEDIHLGFVSDIESRSLSVGSSGSAGKPALLAALGNFVRSIYFNPQGGWQVIDQYQSPVGQSDVRLATSFQATPQATLDLVTYDDTAGILAFSEQQEGGTYRYSRDIKLPEATVRHIHSGTFSDPVARSLMLGCDKSLMMVDFARSEFSIQQTTAFEPTIKRGRLGPFAAGDVNGDGKQDLVLIEQNRHHIQILSTEASGQLVERYTFKVFEDHRGVEDQRFRGRNRNSGQPRAITLGDVTGDGKTDLIVQVHDRIIVYPQD